MDNATYVYRYLKGKGLGNAQIAGIMGNMQIESGFNPSAWNEREQARGLAQWEGGRRTGPNGLLAFAQQRHTTETDLQTQLDFFWQEVTESYSDVLSAIRGTGDPAQVAAIWDQRYEGSTGEARQARQSAAQSIYATIQSGHDPVGGGATSGSPTVKPDVDPNAPFQPGHIPADTAITSAEADAIKSYLIARGWKFDLVPGNPSNHRAYNVTPPGGDTYKNAPHGTVYIPFDINGKINRGVAGVGILTGYYNYELNQGWGSGSGKGPVITTYPFGLGHVYDFLDSLGGIVKGIGWLFNAKHLERIGLFLLGAVLIYMTSKELLGSS